MAIIIKSKRSVQNIEGAQEAERKTNIAIVKWSQKWQAPGDRVYATYLELVKRSNQLEAQRLGLFDDWNHVQLNMLEHCSSKYVSLNRRGEIEKGSNTVALMSALLAMDKKHREVFHSLGIDSFDLFYADTQKLKHLLPAYPWP